MHQHCWPLITLLIGLFWQAGTLRTQGAVLAGDAPRIALDYGLNSQER